MPFGMSEEWWGQIGRFQQETPGSEVCATTAVILRIRSAEFGSCASSFSNPPEFPSGRPPDHEMFARGQFILSGRLGGNPPRFVHLLMR
jgi:hypothetical protein